MTFGTGDIIELKKKHPCGYHTWQVINADEWYVRIQCIGCGRQVTFSRKNLENNVNIK